MAKFTLYKYVKSEGGWRYRRAAFHSTNRKIKPDIVIVNGVEEHHPEGRYYLNHRGGWIDVGVDALDAQRRRALRIAQLECERLGGAPVSIDERRKSETLAAASAAYLEDVALEVASGNKSQGTYDLFKVTLEKFASFSRVAETRQITARRLDEFAAHILQTSKTRSRRTARNEYLRVLQFLKARGVTIMKNGEKVGLKHAPKVVKGRKVVTNTAGEIERFLAGCEGQRQRTLFLTLQRAGLRRSEAMTTRVQDVVLDAANPHIIVDERTVLGYHFKPKAYQCRAVSIDPALVEEYRKLLTLPRKSELLFETNDGKLERHIWRQCKQIAKRAGFDAALFRPHRFRANFAVHCLRKNMDLETLRQQMGHIDTESLRVYINALEGEDRAAKVAQVFADAPITLATSS